MHHAKWQDRGMFRGAAGWVLGIALAGCAPHPVDPPRPLAWDCSAHPTRGVVRVVPVLVDVPAPRLSEASWIGAPLPVDRLRERVNRTRQLASVPEAAGIAVPGALAGALGARWDGTFHAAALPRGGRERWLAAVQGRVGLENTLGGLARAVGGTATLFVWVDDLQGAPLSATDGPGDVVRTAAGPVVIDDAEEPYEVRARIGVALVAADGEVVLRYVDTYDALLTDRADADQAGRDLARRLAAQVVRLWPTDPRLRAG